jgi:hypothetical protein
MSYKTLYYKQHMTVDTKNKLCPNCKREFTDEEVMQKHVTCWFCLAEVLYKLGENSSIPDPKDYGRPNAQQELETQMRISAVRKLSNPMPTESAVTESTIVLTEDERKEFFKKFGVDPGAPAPVTIITVKGKNDDTYLQFSLRGEISPKLKVEIETWLKGMLDLVGTIITFGPNFGSTIIKMKMISPEMFLTQP